MRFTIFAVAAMLATSAQAATEMVVNGGFETWGLGANSDEFSTNYGPGNGQLAGWTTSGLAFVFVPGDTTAVGRYGGFELHGPATGTANGLTTSVQGGNYVASDADRGFGAPVTQLVTGFTVGKVYNVKFEWAAAQQNGFDGDTTEAWQASILASNAAVDSGTTVANFVTATVNNPNHGFQPWRTETFGFNATETSHLLRFWALGGPAGLPPFALLDGVSITASVPEPATWGLMIGGFGLVGAAARRRRTNAVVA